MCKYCDKKLIENGEQEWIADDEYDAGALGAVYLSAVIFEQEGGIGKLIIDFSDKNNEPLVQSYAAINYCPICGRKF